MCQDNYAHDETGKKWFPTLVYSKILGIIYNWKWDCVHTCQWVGCHERVSVTCHWNLILSRTYHWDCLSFHHEWFDGEIDILDSLMVLVTKMDSIGSNYTVWTSSTYFHVGYHPTNSVLNWCFCLFQQVPLNQKVLLHPICLNSSKCERPLAFLKNPNSWGRGRIVPTFNFVYFNIKYIF